MLKLWKPRDGWNRQALAEKPRRLDDNINTLSPEYLYCSAIEPHKNRSSETATRLIKCAGADNLDGRQLCKLGQIILIGGGSCKYNRGKLAFLMCVKTDK
jgi:hypothetical protein